MRRIFALCIAIAGAYSLFGDTAQADIGNCYSAKPICITGHPVCLCDYAQNCFWACR